VGEIAAAEVVRERSIRPAAWCGQLTRKRFVYGRRMRSDVEWQPVRVGRNYICLVRRVKRRRVVAAGPGSRVAVGDLRPEWAVLSSKRRRGLASFLRRRTRSPTVASVAGTG